MGNFEEKNNFSDLRATHIEIDLSRIIISWRQSEIQNILKMIYTLLNIELFK